MPLTTDDNPPAADSPPAPPSLPGYVVSPAPIHEDARTLTYGGRDRALRRRVLLTVARNPADLGVLQRLRREAGILRSLEHAHILALHPGRLPLGSDVLAREYVPGPTLAERLSSSGSGGLELPSVCRWASEIALALDYAHTHGVIHGDLQPAHILIPPRAPARLLGFGAELPPTADARVDVYGLAAVVFHALTGAVPSYEFPAARQEGGAGWRYTLTSTEPFRPPLLTAPNAVPGSTDTLDAYLVSPSQYRPDVTPRVAEVIRRGLAARPQDRYGSPGLFAAALQTAAEEEPVASVSAPMGAARLLRPVILAGSLALLAAGVEIGLHQSSRPAPRTPHATESVVVFRPTVTVDSLPARPAHVKVKAARLASALPRAKSQIAAALAQVQALAPETPSPSIPRPVRAVRRRPFARRAVAQLRSQRTHAARRSAPAVSHMAWLKVTARQTLHPFEPAAPSTSIHAARVYLDGKPSPSLAVGEWVRVPPGRHLIAFYPRSGGLFDPNVNFHVDLAPGRRRNVQIPLPLRTAEVVDTQQS